MNYMFFISNIRLTLPTVGNYLRRKMGIGK
jgi:hypothetical protein